MTGDFLQIGILITQPEQVDMLVALLSECGFEGFEESGGILLAFVQEDQMQEECLREVLSRFGLDATRTIIPVQNWNESWEKNFQPVTVGSFCHIRADFHPQGNKTVYEVIITPKMSFGTGHHATTYLMVEAIEQLELSARKILDFGTGTGILAILCEKAGAREIVAIDQDAQSIDNAADNLIRNHCQHVVLLRKDNLDKLGVFDVILANLNLHVIRANLGQMRQHLSSRGVLLVSGLLDVDLPEMERLARSQGMEITGTYKRESWICLFIRCVDV